MITIQDRLRGIARGFLGRSIAALVIGAADRIDVLERDVAAVRAWMITTDEVNLHAKDCNRMQAGLAHTEPYQCTCGLYEAQAAVGMLK